MTGGSRAHETARRKVTGASLPDLVSILIPAYNAESWIRQTIRAALDQTWSRKEIIVLDDGSRDRTLEIARSFSSKSVKVLTQENQGACAARNRLLREAQGTYLQWLDADDLMAPDKIALQLAGAEPGCRSRILLTAAQGTFFFSGRRARFRPTGLWRDLSNVDWITTKFTENAWLNPTSWLVSRRLSELAGPWDHRLSKSGDDDGEYPSLVNGVIFRDTDGKIYIATSASESVLPPVEVVRHSRAVPTV